MLTLSRLFIGLISIIVTLLANGCAHSYNPQTTDMSIQDQCTTLERQMLFGNNYSINSSQWSNQVDQNQLQKAFHRLNCYQVLGKTPAK